ncbi:MAG: VCBS repeat-containing protein [Acidobacteriaceae bacterium]|jgi:hypothetical protein
MRYLSAFYALVLALATAPLLAQVNPVPFVNNPLVPGAIQPGEKNFTLTVNGTGFVPGATVNWNGTARPTTYISSSRLMATITRSEISVPKTALVTVTNPAPGGGTSNSVPFAVTVPTSTISFATPLTMAVPGASVIAVGDFNNDGKPDLAIGAGCVGQAFCSSTPSDRVEGMVSVFLGKGDGTFTAMPPFGVTGVPQKIVAGDFTNDGNMDLAVAQFDVCGGCAYITVFHGNGNGTFGAGVRAFTTEGDYFDMATGDFNRDGHLDLAAVFTYEPTTLGVTLPGNGDGTFAAGTFFGNTGDGPWPTASLAVADLNRDGILDAAANASSANGFVAYIGKGDGTLSALASAPLGNDSTAAPLLLGDFTSDGIVDIVASTQTTPDTLLTLQGNGDGTFTLLNNQPLAGTLVNSVTDWNGDGAPDVASVDSQGNLNLYLGNENGTFQPAGTPAAGLIAGGAMAVADFNQDGRPDIAYYNPTSGTVNVLLQTQGYQATVKPPLSPSTSKTYKAFQGSIPVAFSLSQYGDSACILPPAKILVTETAGSSPGVVPQNLYVTWPDDGAKFVADTSACEYTYNLATWSLGPGTYQIQISLYGIGVGNATFKLK